MQLHISQSLLDPYTFRSVSHIFFFKPDFVCVYVFLPFSMSHINCFLGLGNPSVGIHQEADAKSGLEMQATYWRKGLWRREWRRKQASAEKACRAQYRTGLWCDRAEKKDYAVLGSQYSFMKVSVGMVGSPQHTSSIRTVPGPWTTGTGQHQRWEHSQALASNNLGEMGHQEKHSVGFPGVTAVTVNQPHPFPHGIWLAHFYGHPVEGKNYRQTMKSSKYNNSKNKSH